MDAMAAQGESLLRMFHQMLGTVSAGRATLPLVFAEKRRRMGATLRTHLSAM
jgi:hypothetical protein